MTHCTQLPQLLINKKKLSQQNAIHDQQLVRQSLMAVCRVSKSNLVYSSLVYFDNKLTLICLLTYQRKQFLSVIHKVFNLSASLRTKVQGEWGA